jgi:2-iminoacetate synthase
MKEFLDRVRATDRAALEERLAGTGPARVEEALSRESLEEEDLLALLSPAADPFLEEITRRSAGLTERRFGRVIQLYVPLYLSNECVNQCLYCGFAHRVETPRLTLEPAEAVAEARLLHEEGFRHILLVSGEDPRRVDLPYLLRVVGELRPLFHSIAIEIQPLDRESYARLVAAGVDGLALYQEVYDPVLYRRYHPAGPKRSLARRLAAIAAGGEAGMRSLGIGALLGLAPWRAEAFMLLLHGRALARTFWRSRVSVSFPRLNDAAGGFRAPFPVDDRSLVHMLCTARLALPDAELVVSTRERAGLRDNLIGLGVTRMSAGSRTSPGAYSHPSRHEGEQFRITDNRPPAEIARAIAARRREPVWKDFDRHFIAP